MEEMPFIATRKKKNTWDLITETRKRNKQNQTITKVIVSELAQEISAHEEKIVLFIVKKKNNFLKRV